MKKITSIILCTVMILTMTCINTPVNASQANVTLADFNMFGISLSADSFKETFSGNPHTRDVTVRESLPFSANLSLENISINQRNIRVDAQLNTTGGTVSIPIRGLLSAGFRTQTGINSIIVEVQNTTQEYEILLFEIFNDTAEDSLLIVNKEEYATTPHIKIYIQDIDDNVYLLESDMPECFGFLDASQYPLADKNNDALWWARNLVNHQNDNLATNYENLTKLGLNTQTRALNSFSMWAPETIFRDTFYLAGSLVECWSLPYVEYKHVNVSSSDSTWTARFKVAEHVEIQGVTYYGNNAYQYRNVSLSFGAGDKTIFLRALQEGRFTDSNAWVNALKENGETITASLLKYTAQRVGGSTFATVLNIVSNMSSSNATVTLGQQGMDLREDNATAVGEKLPTKYVFETSYDQSGNGVGDYFILQAVAQYEGAGSCSTTGALVFSFDVEYDGELTTIEKSIQLNYTAAP